MHGPVNVICRNESNSSHYHIQLITLLIPPCYPLFHSLSETCASYIEIVRLQSIQECTQFPHIFLASQNSEFTFECIYITCFSTAGTTVSVVTVVTFVRSACIILLPRVYVWRWCPALRLWQQDHGSKFCLHLLIVSTWRSLDRLWWELHRYSYWGYRHVLLQSGLGLGKCPLHVRLEYSVTRWVQSAQPRSDCKKKSVIPVKASTWVAKPVNAANTVNKAVKNYSNSITIAAE